MKIEADKITPFTKEQMALMDKNRTMKSRSAHADHSDTPPLPGNIRLQRGDLIRASGIYFMVVMANPSRALIVATEGREVQVVNRVTGEQQASFTAPGKDESISRDLPKESLVARLGETGFMEFLGGLSVLRRRALGLDAIIINETKGQDSMKTPDENGGGELPKGGLVAEAIRAGGGKTKTPKAKKEKKTKEDTGARGALGAIMGNSVVAVLRTLGREGVTTPHARAIVKAQGIKCADATVSIQVSAGRNGKTAGKDAKKVTYAELTQAQIKELKASAPEPKEEPAAPKTKKGKKS
jgi:hypothetical protein